MAGKIAFPTSENSETLLSLISDNPELPTVHASLFVKTRRAVRKYAELRNISGADVFDYLNLEHSQELSQLSNTHPLRQLPTQGSCSLMLLIDVGTVP